MSDAAILPGVYAKVLPMSAAPPPGSRGTGRVPAATNLAIPHSPGAGILAARGDRGLGPDHQLTSADHLVVVALFAALARMARFAGHRSENSGPGRWNHSFSREPGRYGWPCPARSDRGMAYDEDLAARVGDLIGPDPELTEKKMSGGLGFLIRGHMAVSASGQGGVLVHVDPWQSGELVATTRATTAVMQGREMPGWLRVRPEDLAGDDVSRWVERGIRHARSLPPKQPANKKPKK